MRKTRNERADGMRRLHALEGLGYALGIMASKNKRGCRPMY
jgi:hypothetical protein